MNPVIRWGCRRTHHCDLAAAVALEELALDEDEDDSDQDPESKDPDDEPVEPRESDCEEELVAVAAAEDEVRDDGLAAWTREMKGENRVRRVMRVDVERKDCMFR